MSGSRELGEKVRGLLASGLQAQRQGRLETASKHYEQVLEALPRQADALHLLGLTRFQSGRPEEARELIRKALEQDPKRVNAWSDLGMVLGRLGDHEDSLKALDQALELRPDHPDALNNKAQTLRRLGRHDQALPLLREVTRLQSGSAAAAYFLADSLFRTDRTEEALAIYRRAARMAPDDRRIRLGLGEVLESLGQFEQARLQYLALLRRQPDNAMALARLLQMRDRPAESEWVERARKLAAAEGTPEPGRIHLEIALGHWHDRNNEPESAFAHLERGYGALARQQPFDSDAYTRAIDTLVETLDSGFYELAETSGLDSNRPIFIVGMPRSGTTLTEQILASHSQVAAGGELSMLLQVSHDVRSLATSGRSYPDGLPELRREDLRQLGERYLLHLDRISTTAAHVTDKLPFNFMHLGLIALLFPRARIVHCHRQPLDNCLSCYFTSFSDGIRFANRLDTLGRYYLDYHRLMEHWHKVLPAPILDLPYESLVDDTEHSVARLLAFCGLEWEDACLEFHQTERAVRTPSRWQVRQPIYSRSVGRWRRYESQLEPLRALLEPLLPKTD